MSEIKPPSLAAAPAVAPEDSLAAWQAQDPAVLAQEVLRLRAELQARRDDQQAFLRVVSHDLRSPVRHVVSYGQLVRELVLESNADPAALQFLDTITQSAQQLGRMIDGLIALGRIGTAELQLQALPLGEVLQDALRQAQASAPDRCVQWQVPELAALPAVRADLALLRDLLRHLLDNALKFTRQRPDAEIALTAAVDGAQLVLTLRDNGAGYNPEHQAQLFGVFQRLHATRDFEGLGLGLAAARRIVDRLGGQISLHGELNQGCTVTLQLPLA